MAPSGVSTSVNTRARLKYSALVFLGGACYGIVSSVIKIAYAAGFSFRQTTAAQTFFALVAFCAIALFDRMRGWKRPHLAWQQRVKLIAMGMVSCGTTTCYYFALSQLSASMSIVLLFQFTWMGLIFEIVSTKHRPTNAAFLAALVIVLGTLFASGLFGGGVQGGLNVLGVLFGLLAAICCATFMFLSGRVETQLPTAQRGLWASVGYFIVGMLICPTFFTSGVLTSGLWSYGLVLGILSFACPMLLFGVACKHLSPGLSTIMASSELPISILCAVLILHEAVTPFQVVGVCLILAGVVVAQLPALRRV